MSSNKVALVTGAGSGIGKGCATALLDDGWNVVFTGRRLEALQTAIAEAGAAGSRGMAIPCDVGQEASVAALFEAVRQRLTTPDELSAAAWRQAVDTNLNGAFFCLSEAFKLMRYQDPQGGRIINNGSISAHSPRPGSIAYTATKHAISGLTRAASLDGRAFNIAVGQIDIGNVASDMTARMIKGVPQADGSIKPEDRMDLSAVSDTFMAMARLPLSANVLFMTVMATKMPFVGRG
jgi:NAD(P)-dependent dehydrogenase (short-subunit alcohol dehydrogenase family)